MYPFPRFPRKVAAGGLKVQDVFNTSLWDGTGADQPITTGVNLASKGGAALLKRREGVSSFYEFDSTRTSGAQFYPNLSTDLADAVSFVGLNVNSSGFDTSTTFSVSGASYVAWSIAKAAKFYYNTAVTKSSGSNVTVSLASLGTVGMVRVKRTDASGSWYVWHRSLTAGNLLIGESTAGQAPLGHITVSGTTLTLVDGVIADGSYFVEAFAHDPDTVNGIIQCGSYVGIGDTNTITLGWEPQFLSLKNRNSTNSNWYMFDTARGINKILYSNTPGSELTSGQLHTTATGFVIDDIGAPLNTGSQYIDFVAIRKGPM